MKVPRYSIDVGSIFQKDKTGSLVKFEDYQKLENAIRNYFVAYKNEGKVNGWCKRVDAAKQEIFDLLK